ncbi:RDD family protein [Natrinema sp. SYSU A 869]|uniref:RDD family protein n=1 Tax=Natrinema sp. SYSU A 869 TaxID=2871694 RepID=UPI001CA42204|nr:RDD family protein [Natrinema sp. SYSU A 869]
MGYEIAWGSFEEATNVIWVGAPVVGWIGYFVVCEGATGTAVGKRLLGLAVADADGGPARGRQVLVRNLVRLLEASLLYLPSVLAIAITERGQRLGDLAAGTIVGVRDRRQTAASSERGASATDHADTDSHQPSVRT